MKIPCPACGWRIDLESEHVAIDREELQKLVRETIRREIANAERRAPRNQSNYK